MKNDEIKNILIFGSEGSEKTSFFDTLVNNDDKKILEEKKHYRIVETTIDDSKYRIIDLVGANDLISAADEPRAKEELISLADKLKSGINHFLILNNETPVVSSKTKEQIFYELFIDEDFVKADHTTFVNNNFADFRDQDAQDREIQDLLDDSETPNYLKELIMKNKFLLINSLSADQKESNRILWEHLTSFENSYFSKKLEKLLKREINLKDLTSNQLWELRNQNLKITTSRDSLYQSDSVINGQELAQRKIDSDVKALVWSEVSEKLEKAKKARNILMIGRTGAGKSSLANLLADQNLFKTGTGSISITKDYQSELFNNEETGITYRIIDTIGLGDTTLSQEEVLNKLLKVTERLENGLHQVLFVVSGRFTKEEVAVFEALRALFGEEVVNYCTIVRNRFPEFRNPIRSEQDFENLVDEEGKIREVLEKIRGEIIYLDNPPLVGSVNRKEAAKKIQQASREKLLNHLTTKRLPYQVNLDQAELNQRIQAHLDPLEKQVQETQKELTQKQEQLNQSRPTNQKITDWNRWKKGLLNKPIEQQSQLEQDVYKLHSLLEELKNGIPFMEKQIKKIIKKIVQLRQINTDSSKEEIIKLRIEKQEINKKIREQEIEKFQKEAGLKDHKVWTEYWKDYGFTPQQVKEWMAVGLEEKDSILAVCFRFKGYAPNTITNLEKMKEENKGFFWERKNSQQALDWFYPSETRREKGEVKISQSGNCPHNLTDSLIFNGRDWPTLESLEINHQRDLDSIQLVDLPWLDRFSMSDIGNISPINVKIDNCSLLTLSVSGFSSLEVSGDFSELSLLILFDIKSPINLDFLSSCSNLSNIWIENLDLGDDKLGVLQKLPNKKKITFLRIKNIELPKQDLSFLTEFTGLERLELQSPHFYGSLRFLSGMKNLKTLEIFLSENIEGDLEYLPENLEIVKISNNDLRKKLEKYQNRSGFDFNYQNWRKDNQQLIAQVQVPPKGK